MEIPHFENYLNHRNNRLDEKWLDWLFGRKQQQPQVDPTPQTPEDVQRDPHVEKYTNQVLRQFGLFKPDGSPRTDLEILDRQGKPTGKTWNGEGLEQFVAALKRFVAGHIYGGGESNITMRIHATDANQIVKFLDMLQSPGASESLSDQLGIDQTNLDLWIQPRVPVHTDALKQVDYARTAGEFAKQRRIARTPPGQEYDKHKVENLWEKAVEVTKYLNASRLPQYFRHQLELLLAAADNIKPTGVEVAPPESRPSTGRRRGKAGEWGGKPEEPEEISPVI